MQTTTFIAMPKENQHTSEKQWFVEIEEMTDIVQETIGSFSFNLKTGSEEEVKKVRDFLENHVESFSFSFKDV